MRALSLTQPWPWIIVHLDKRIENRSRNIGNYRGPVLLHAALRCTAQDWWTAFEFVRDRVGLTEARTIPHPDQLERGAIVGRCEVAGQFDARAGQISIPTEVDDAVWAEQKKRWYMGQHAYLLANVEPTRVVPCKGALGFWNVPNVILKQVQRRTFVDLVVAGEVDEDEFDDYVDLWHGDPTQETLYEWLGFTRDEWAAIVVHHDIALHSIVEQRKKLSRERVTFYRTTPEVG